MTEQEWLTCIDPDAMLKFLRGKASGRKRRLFACACCRYISDWLRDKESQTAIEVAERYADGRASDKERIAARNTHQLLTRTLMDSTERAAYRAVREVLAHPFGFREACTWSAAAEVVGQTGFVCVILLDLFGNPFQRASIPSATVLTWNDAIVVKLAESIYDDRAFDRLPILADALEEAGCTNANILNHCRQPGEHVRGCWVVDLLLGKS